MANSIQIYRSTTTGHVPTLAAGGLGVNLTDGLMWIGNGSTSVLYASAGLFTSQSAGRFYASPSGGAGAATFRAIVAADLGTGSASSSTYLRGDGTWATPSIGVAGVSGQVIFNSAGALVGSSGFTYTVAAGLGVSQGVLTTAVSAATISATYNNAAVTFPGALYVNVTNTASTSSSNIFCAAAGPNGFTVDVGGNAHATGALTAGNGLSVANQAAFVQAWSSAGTVYPAPIQLNVTNMASATGSLLMDLQVGGASVHAVDKAGHIITGGASPTSGGLGAGAGTGATLTSLTGSDTAGLILLTAGTAPAANDTIFSVNFGTAWASTPRAVILSPATRPTSGGPSYGSWMATRSTSGWGILSGPTALIAGTNYGWFYQILG